MELMWSCESGNSWVHTLSGLGCLHNTEREGQREREREKEREREREKERERERERESSPRPSLLTTPLSLPHTHSPLWHLWSMV